MPVERGAPGHELGVPFREAVAPWRRERGFRTAPFTEAALVGIPTSVWDWGRRKSGKGRSQLVRAQSTEVVLYTQPHSPTCRQVESFLRERGVAFAERDISRDPGAVAELVEQGFMSTPVTRVGETWVAGFSRSKLARVLKELD